MHIDSGYETGAESSKEQYRTETGKLREEAETLHFMPKTSKLPI